METGAKQKWKTALTRNENCLPKEEDTGVGPFVDEIEGWEQNAIDGKGPGPKILLTAVKKDKAGAFKLQEKYKGMFLLDKDPEDEHGGVAPEDEWKHRKIIGVVWMTRKGWGVETKAHD